ncbi:MAG TPA: addiction module toxin, HicA family [Ignavibacteria bacterium]|nr:addiction module toxin, HicA family [Ignavibacteria bacterium]
MPKLYSSKYIIMVLLQNGFILISQRGSHAKYKKGQRTVIVPSPKKQIPIGTFRSILRQSGLTNSDFDK